MIDACMWASDPRHVERKAGVGWLSSTYTRVGLVLLLVGAVAHPPTHALTQPPTCCFRFTQRFTLQLTHPEKGWRPLTSAVLVRLLSCHYLQYSRRRHSKAWNGTAHPPSTCCPVSLGLHTAVVVAANFHNYVTLP